jgi:hypothetical protein
MRNFTKKRKLAVAGVIVALVAAGGAFAYWTGTGGGTGTGTVAAGGSVTLTGTVAVGLAPGGSKQVTLTAANSGTSPASVANVTLTAISSVPTGCIPSGFGDFSMADVSQPNTVIAAGASNVALLPGTLVYALTGANQDACKNAVLTLTLAST